MYIWWKDSEIKQIAGTEYMVVYEFGKCARYMKNVPGFRAEGVDYWIDVDRDEVLDAMDVELQASWDLQEHYDMERQGL